MKKLFILYTIIFIIVAGCSNTGGSSSDNSTGNNGNTGNNEQIVSSENPIVYGSNTVNYDKTKQLHTLVYFAGDKYGNYTSKDSYTISSNNNAVTQSYDYSYYKQPAEELSPKEQFNERIRNFQLYAENAGLKPIEKKDDALYKTAPQVVEVDTKWNNVYVQDFDNNQFKKQELIPASLSVLPDYVLKISANSIGIAAPRTRNYPVKFDFIQKQAVTGGDDNEPVKISIGENEFEISPTSALKISGIVCAILVVPVLLLMMLLPKTAQNSSAKVQEINKQIASIDDEIKKFSDSNKSNQFNEQDSIKTTLENNKTKLMSYSALGASVPKTLWITYFSAQNNGLIDIQGEAESVEDVYAFFRNMKDSLLNSNLRLHKLQLISDNVDELVEDGMLSEGYEFEITNMSEEELGMTEEVPQEEKDNNKNTKNVSKKSTPPKELPKQKSSKRSGNYAKEVTGK